MWPLRLQGGLSRGACRSTLLSRQGRVPLSWSGRAAETWTEAASAPPPLGRGDAARRATSVVVTRRRPSCGAKTYAARSAASRKAPLVLHPHDRSVAAVPPCVAVPEGRA